MPRILVVDDESKIRDILEKFFTKSGFDVVKAEDGDKAISILKSAVRIDLMILDIKMPGINGKDIFREIRGIDVKLPVIFLTGSFDAIANSEILSKTDMADVKVCYKPVDLFVLLEMVKKEIGAG